MSKFITGKELEDSICEIIWHAEKVLLIVSPFIKLDEYFKKHFDKHSHNPNLHIILVFGKNEKNVKKSLSKDDFNYFKKFLNISIVYVPNLHAKYYGNEKEGVITSINLYDHSFKNNIEFGVFSQQSLLNFSSKTDDEAFNYCIDMAHENEVVFINRPVYQTKKLIINLGKNYIKSEVLHDLTEKFYGVNTFRKRDNDIKYLKDFPDEIELGPVTDDRPLRTSEPPIKKKQTGYCIRTGKEIPFNPERPLSIEAWREWNEFKNLNYPEKYCHKSGRESKGKTSVANPILKTNELP